LRKYGHWQKNPKGSEYQYFFHIQLIISVFTAEARKNPAPGGEERKTSIIPAFFPFFSPGQEELPRASP